MKIMFVCTGNTCRSPMCEAMLRHRLHLLGRDDIAVGSCGLSAQEGAPASPNAVLALAELGIDLTAHRARQATPALLADADRILCMSEMHLTLLALLAPEAAPRAALLGRGVSDPFGGDLDEYRAARDIISRELTLLIEELTGQKG